MAKPGTGRQQRRRYEYLSSAHFTPLEAREFSTLPKATPALKLIMEGRATRRARFEKVAASKIARGVWRREDVPRKWVDNLARMYNRRNWRVQEGPRGAQQPMLKGSPNPWAMYRAAEKVAPPKKDISPWQLRRVFGKTRLEKGLVFVQRAERQGGTNEAQIKQWVKEKDESILKAQGQRKEQLIIERNRLERLL